MKSNLFVLTKVLLKSTDFSSFKLSKKKGMQIAFLSLMAFSFIPIVFSIVLFTSHVFDILSKIGQEGIILSLAINLDVFLIFFFGIFIILSTFYFAGDIERLLPLPLKPYEIIGAKFITAVFYEYLTEALFLAPILIAFGIKNSSGAIYYLYSLLVFLIVPVIPLVVAAFIVMFVMRFTSFGKNKDLLKIIGGVIAIFMAIGINILVQKLFVQTPNSEQILQMLTQAKNSLMKITSSVFPGLLSAGEALINAATLNGLVNMLVFIGIALLGMLLIFFLGESLYFKGVIGLSESLPKRVRLKKKDKVRLLSPKSPLKTYILKEIKILFRTPIFFLNCILANFMWPLIFLIPFVTEIAKDGDGFSSVFNSIKDSIQNVDNGLVFISAVAFIIFASASNAIATTAISREGKGIIVNKYIPIRYLDQIMAKTLTSVWISIINLFAVLLFMIVFLKTSIFLILLVIPCGLAGILLISLAGVMIDLMNPKLDWTNEQRAVKQNMNLLIGILGGLAFSGVLFFVVYKLELALIGAFLLTMAIFAGLFFALYNLLRTKGVKLFESIEI